MAKKKLESVSRKQELLKNHARHMGLYAKVATQVGVDPSFVSRVVRGERNSKTILDAVLNELQKIT